MNKGKGLVLAILGLLFLSSFVIAREHREFAGSVKLAGKDVDTLVLDVPTGKVNINVVDSDDVTYEVKVEDKSAGLTMFVVDLEDLELTAKRSGRSLYLKVDEEGVTQKWALDVPRNLALEINLGVGNVALDGLSESLVADIGVGSAWIAANSAEYRHVSAEVGVGEVQVQGFDLDTIHKRVMVSDQLSISGQGSQKIEIKIGVGDVNLSDSGQALF